MDDRVRVAVVVGGRDSERASAAGVVGHLDPTRFAATVVPIAPDDVSAAWAEADVVFPVLHGPFGGNGTIQGLLDLAGVRYVGSGLLAAAAGVDREFTTKLLTAGELPAGKAVVLRAGTATLSAAAREHLGLPVVVAPASTRAAAGSTTVAEWSALDGAIAAARTHGPKVVVSAAAPGRQMDCGVLEFPDGTVAASLPVDAESAPAKLDDDVAAQIQELAVAAFRALDCSGLARITCALDDDGGSSVAEVVPMPELTPDSTFVRAWAVTGLDYAALLATLVDTALGR